MPTLRESPKRKRNPNPDSIGPGDSVSVAGRRTCKAHAKCKKGDKCGRHGKQSRTQLQQVQQHQQQQQQQQQHQQQQHQHQHQHHQQQKVKGQVAEHRSSGTIVIATTPSIAQAMSPHRARGSYMDAMAELTEGDTRPGSLAAPSVLASSDVLGPVQSREVKLQEEALREIIAMDPAENVKKFLIHQHLQHLEEQRAAAPPVPQKTNEELLRAMTSPQTDTFPTENGVGAYEDDQVSELGPLLPPVQEDAPLVVPPISRTKTPALGLRTTNIAPAPPASVGYSPMSYRARGSMLRTTTPFSEMDVPIGSSTPMVPDFRNQSASVPPDMTYGVLGQRPTNRSSLGALPAGKLMAPAPPPPPPPPPSASGGMISRRGTQSTNGMRPGGVILEELEESAEWEDASDKTSTSAQSAPHAAPTSHGGVNSSIRVHSGWMRKRRTNWFRHEWPELHFVLRGTRLGIHKDQHSAEDGFIEMDDYSVACSNSASTKLSAAFKSWKIKNGQGNMHMSDGAFFFQLVPCNEKERRKGSPPATKAEKKVHHFAVKSRDERIDWMRELMLAKAIKQKGEGFDVEVNGEKV